MSDLSILRPTHRLTTRMTTNAGGTANALINGLKGKLHSLRLASLEMESALALHITDRDNHQVILSATDIGAGANVELLLDGDMASADGWTLGGTAAIAGGVMAPTAGTYTLAQTLYLFPGVYTLTFDSPTNTGSNPLAIDLQPLYSEDDNVAVRASANISGTGTTTHEFTVPVGGVYVLTFTGIEVGSITLDNISLKQDVSTSVLMTPRYGVIESDGTPIADIWEKYLLTSNNLLVQIIGGGNAVDYDLTFYMETP